MSRKQLPLPLKINLKIIFLLLILFVIINFIFSLILTQKAFSSLREANFEKASPYSKQAIIFPKILSKITFGKIAEIEAWQTSLSLAPELEKAEQDLTNLAQTIFQSKNEDNNLTNTYQNLEKISLKLNKLKKLINSSQLLQKFKLVQKLNSTAKLSKDSLIFFEEVLNKPHSFLILLQNTQELRASGGFMGSYARIDLQNGKINNLKIQDIYEPDGQFTGFVEAPVGAQKYLSGGEGLRLPDSNWHPDLPTSAQTTLSYFAFGKEQKIESAIALNVDLIEKLLLIMGEVYLPDYGVTVTADNLSALARADREEFFAGSKQKANFLTALFDNLKLKLENLDRSQQKEILELIKVALETKNIQLFSTNQNLQKIFTKTNIAGELRALDSDAFYFYSLESNVGINKANQNIIREVKINLGESRTDLEINFENKSIANSLDYINYQRLILNPEINIGEIIWNNEKITDYDEEIIFNSRGTKFKQVGFLIPVETGQNGGLRVSLIGASGCNKKECAINLQKQSGLPATPYAISFRDQNKNLILEKDEVVEF